MYWRDYRIDRVRHSPGDIGAQYRALYATLQTVVAVGPALRAKLIRAQLAYLVDVANEVVWR